jgi:hypothetical protein
MKTLLVLTVAGLIVSSSLGNARLASEGIAANEPRQKTDNTVEVTAEKDKATYVVKSPSGIGKSAIERPAAEWPKTVVLRLHMKGLESFRASNGKVTLDAAVAFRDGTPQVRIWKDGQENELLHSKSPFWMTIRMVGGDDKPPKPFRSRTATSRSKCPRRSLRATRGRSQ